MPKQMLEFDRPPIDEIAISLQFDPLPGFRAVHIGRFWTRIRDRYPSTEDLGQLPATSDGGPGPVPVPVQMISFGPAPVLPRTWFFDDSRNRLIQLQPGRFVRNWRKLTDTDRYPGYSVLIDEFKLEWANFLSFLQEEGVGLPSVNLCELTYVDHIEPVADDKLGELSSIFTFMQPAKAGSFLASPEIFLWSAAYRVPAGRLQIDMNPVLRARDMRRMLAVNFTLRGQPPGKSDDHVFSWFDRAHECVNKAFEEITEPRMHQVWGRK